MNSTLIISALIGSLLFYADYDASFDAVYSRGNGTALIEADRYAPCLTTNGGGRYGEAAEFSYEDLVLETVWTKDVVRYQAKDNFPYNHDKPFDGAIGMWLQIDMEELKNRPLIWLDPVHLLGPNSKDSGKIWMDFVTKELPDTPIFRFGATLPREARTNPDNSGEGHFIIVPHVDFAGDEWHHMVGTWHNLNNADSTGVLHLYFDGKRVGAIEGFSHTLDWNIEEWEIRVGLAFKGKIDEFFILDKFMSADEVNTIYSAGKPIGELLEVE